MSEKQMAQDCLARMTVEFLERGGDPGELLGDGYEKTCEGLLDLLETLELKVAAQNVWTWIRHDCDRTKRSAKWLSATDYRKDYR